MAGPHKDDVVVRQKHGNPSTYLLGTSATPEQFIVQTRDEAVSKALAYARHQHVQAWFDHGDDTFELIGSSPTEKRELSDETSQLVQTGKTVDRREHRKAC